MKAQHQARTSSKDGLTAAELESGKTYVETTTLAQDLRSLILKIVVIAAVFALLFTFVFGFFRNEGGAMSPAVNDGDLVLSYHLDKDYVAGDTTVVDAGGSMQVLRVVAVAGDKVDVTEDGLLINGSLQSDLSITEKTVPYAEGIRFPITVGQSEVFVLGDAREHSTDSRIFGSVDVSATQGKIVGLLRSREI